MKTQTRQPGGGEDGMEHFLKNCTIGMDLRKLFNSLIGLLFISRRLVVIPTGNSRRFLAQSLRILGVFVALTAIAASPVRANDFDEVNDLRVISGHDDGTTTASGSIPAYNDSLNQVSYSISTSAGVPIVPGWTNPATILTQDPYGAELTWVEHAISPRWDEELIGTIAQATSNPTVSDTYIDLYWKHDGGSWVEAFRLTLGSSGSPKKRPFAIAYEQRSGNGMIVYRGDIAKNLDNTLMYRRTHTDSSGNRVMTGEIQGPTMSTGALWWLKLVPRPNSDEIMALGLDSGGGLWIWTWDPASAQWYPIASTTGGAQSNNGRITGSTSTGNTAFDAVYLADGWFLLTYFASGQNGNVQWAAVNRSDSTPVGKAWAKTGGLGFYTSSNGQYIAISAEPIDGSPSLANPQRIAFAMEGTGTTTDLLGTIGSYAGSGNFTWPAAGIALTSMDGGVYFTNSTNGYVPLAVEWIGKPTDPATTRYAVLVYADKTDTTNGTSNGLDWTSTYPSGNAWNATTQHSKFGNLLNLKLETDFILRRFYKDPTNEGNLFCIFLDEDHKLWGAWFDQTKIATVPWSMMAGANPFNGTPTVSYMTRTNDQWGRPYDVDVHRYVLPTLGAVATQVVPLADPLVGRLINTTLVITDPGGLLDPGDDASDAVNNRDIELSIPLSVTTAGIKWKLVNLCVGGTAVKSTVNPKNRIAHDIATCTLADGSPGYVARSSPDLVYDNSPTDGFPKLYLDVISPFDFGETLKVSGMTLDFDPTAKALASNTNIPIGIGIRTDEKKAQGAVPNDDIDYTFTNSPQFRVVERVDVSSASPQVPNAFLSTGSLSGKPLLTFKLTAKGGNVTVTALNFTVNSMGSPALNFSSSNITNLTLKYGDSTTPGATIGSKSSPADGNFTSTNISLTKDTPVTLTLWGDFQNLQAGQAMNVTLQASGTAVKADGVTSGYTSIDTIAGAIAGSDVSKTHTVSTYTISTTPSPVLYQGVLSITWTPVNVSQPNFFEYSVDAKALADPTKAWNNFTGTAISGKCPAGSSSCNATFPTSDLASSAAYVRLTGTENTDNQTILPAYSGSFKILETVQVGPPASQVKNAFVSIGNLSNLDLLAVTLTTNGGDTEITQLSFTVTPTGGFSLTNYRLFDVGSGSIVAPSQASPLFTSLSGPNFKIALTPPGKSASRTYILRADVTGMAAGGTLTVSIDPSGIKADGLTSLTTGLPSSTITGSPVSKIHTVSTYTITVPATVKFQDPLSFSWTKVNVGDPTAFEYSNDGKLLTDATKTWVDFTGPTSLGRCPTGSFSPCSTATVPTNDSTNPVTANAYIRIRGNESTDNQPLNPPAVSPAFKILERINLQPGPAVSNVLVQSGSDSGDSFSATGDLLKIQLTATGGDVKVTSLNFDPPTTTPANSMSFTAYEVYDGATRIAGPVTSPTFSSINSGSGLVLTKGVPKVLTLRGSVNGIDLGETLTVSIQPSGVVSTGQITGDPLTVDGVTASQLHTASGYKINVPSAGGQVVAATQDWTGVDPTPGAKHPIAWTTFGNAKDGSTGNAVNLSYTYVDVLGATVGPNPLTCNAGSSGAGVCDAVVPVNVSDTVRLQLTDGTHTVVTKPFTIKGIVQITGINPLSLPGLGATWLLGYTKASPAEPYQTVDWEQLGSFNTTAEIFDGVGWREIKTMPIVATGLGPYHMDCVALGSSTCANNFPVGGTDSAQIRVRPADAVTTLGNKIWPPDGVSTFKVRPAFIGITPGGSPLVKGRAVPIKWTPLPGTAPLSADPSSVLPVDSVVIKIIDGNSIVQQTITPSEPNDGQWCDDSTPQQQDATCWKPQAVGSGLRVQICDKQRTTMCGYSAPFDVIDVFVKIGSGAAGQLFVPNSTQTITWGGIDISKSVKLMLKDPSGNVILDVIRNLAPPVMGTKPSVPATYDWTIPNNALVPTPMAGAVIRMEQSDDASIWAETLPFDLRGELQLTSPNGGDKLLLGAAASINWTVKSGTTSAVRIRYSKAGLLTKNDPGWTVLSFNTAFSGATGSFSWSPNAVTTQGRVEICDVADLNVCATSASDFTVAGKLALGEHSGGQASNAFVELPTVNNAELYRFSLAPNGEDVSVTALTLTVSSVIGVVTPDMQTGLTLLQNGNPVTANITVSPAGTPSQITLSLSGVTVTAPSDFVLVGTVGNLAPNDEMTLGLSAATLQVRGVTSGVDLTSLSGAVTGTVSSVRHVTKTYIVLAPAVNDNWPVSTTQNIAWNAIGGADPANVKISLSLDGGTTYPTVIANSPSVQNPFPWLVPLNAISAQAKIKIEDRGAVPAGSIVGYSGGSKNGNLFNITGQINITSPAADARYSDSLSRWPVGSLQTIQWSTVGTMTQFKVYSDATLLTGTVTQLSSSTFKMDFTPGSPSPSAVIKVVDNTTGHPAAQGTANVVFSEVQVLQPNQTDAWVVNSPQTIRWIHTGLQTVDLFYRVGSGLWQPIALAQDATLQQLAWNPPPSARGPQVEIRIVDSINQVNGASAISEQFKVYGQLQLSPVGAAAVGTPVAVTWSTNPAGSVPAVNLYLVDVALPSQSVTLASNTANSGSFNWTPAKATSQAKLRVCDKDFDDVFPAGDPKGCNETTIFPITGIGVDPIPAGPHLVGSKLPISWTQQGVAGGQVWVAYSPDGGTTWKDLNGAVCAPQASCGTIAATGPTGSLPSGGWTVVDDISNNVLIRVADAGGSGAFGLSNTLGITGQLTVTSPAAPANVFSVTDTMPIRWATLGTIPTVHLEYSLNGGTSWSAIASGIANSGSYDWVIPMDVISNNFRVRIVDVAGVAGPHPFTEGRSGVVNVGAKFAFTSPSPAGTDSWSVNSPQTIGWNVTGVGVTSVKLAYSADGITYTNITTVAMAGTSGEAATLPWNVADVVDLVGDPQVTPSQTFMLRITDATSGHPVAAKDSASATAFYYKVNWEVRDASTNTPLNNLQVAELPQIGYIGWTNAPDFNFSGIQPPRYYPYLTQVSTLWSLANNNGASDMSQGPTDTDPVALWKSDRDQTRIVKLEVTSSDAVTWQVKAEHQYDSVNNIVEISAWLEKSGKIVDNLLTDAYVELYADGALIRTLPVPVGSGSGLTADPNGNFRFTWDLTAGGLPVADGKTYFAKTIIRRLGRSFSTGGGINITIPKKIMTSGGGGGTSGPDVSADVAAIKAATVGPGSSLEQIKTTVTPLAGQIAGVQTALDASITNAKNELKTDIADVKSDTTAIKADTAAIRPLVEDMAPKVTAILSDPNAGLPSIKQAITDQGKTLRRGGILNRDMELETGENATIQYRSEGGAPSMSIYNQLGAPVAAPALILNSTTGFYESTVSLASLGAYRVVVSEPSSANSNGTLDSITLTVVEKRATQQDTNNLTTMLTDLSKQLTQVESNLDGHMTTIENAMATKGQADSLIASVNTLKDKWGLLDAAALMTELGNLSTKLGTPPVGSTVSQEIQAVKDAIAGISTTGLQEIKDALGVPAGQTVYGDMAKQQTLAALDARVGTPTSSPTIAAAIEAIGGGGPGGGGSLGTVEGKVDRLLATVGTPQLETNGTTLANELSQVKTTGLDTNSRVQAIQVDITDIRGIVDALPPALGSNLTNLQTAVDNLVNAMGTVTDGSGRTVAKLIQDVEVAVKAIPGAVDYSPQLATLQGDIKQLKTDVGLVPKTDYTASFAALQTALADVQTTLAKLPANGATTDQVNDALAKLTTLQTTVNAIDTAGLNESTTKQLNSLNANVDSLKSQLTPAASTTVANSDTATLLTRLDALQKSVESAQGSSAAVGFSQGAYSAANDALKILQQLQKEIETNGAGSAAAQAQLGQFGDKIKTISSSVSVIPNSFKDSDEELNEQIKKLAQKTQGIASDKGYHFDSLYEMSKDESSDVKAMRNRVEELKNLLDVQRSIIERNMNQPVVTTWFEAR